MIKFATVFIVAIAFATSAFAADKPKSDDGIDHDAIKRLTQEFQAEKAGCAKDWHACTGDTISSSWGRRGEARERCKSVLANNSPYGEPDLPFLAFRHAVFTKKMKAKGIAVFYEPEVGLPNAAGVKSKTSIGCKINLETLEVLDMGRFKPY